MSSLPDNAPSPRLCIIIKWPDFEGYGFNLHAEKSKPGQYIGKVDSNSPAETAGLREGDRIIEVNGANIANENHKQVVQRIKAVTDETRLLVVDAQTDKWYKNKNIVVRGTQENVIVRSSARDQKSSTPEPPSQPAAAVSNGHHDEADNRSVSSAASSSATSEVSTQPQHAATLDEPDKDKDATVEEASAHQPMEDQKSRSRSPSPPPAEEAEQRSDKAAVPQEDAASLSGSDKHSDKDVNVAAEDSLAEATEKNESHDEEPVEKSEQAPFEADAPVKEEAKEEEKVEEKDERPAEATPPPPAEQESDLEAEYDNVEFDAERAAGAHQVVFVHSLPRSSGDSHSSHGSDTARTTDSDTQSPMSTSPTPPPSLEPAPAPEPVRSSPSPKSSSTTKTTTTTNATSNKTNNASPKPVSNNNNSYNSSGLNLNMSAAEMRAKLASKKKADPRRDTVDLKKKYEIIQNM